MFRKIIDSVYDVMVGFREHPLLLCCFACLSFRFSQAWYMQ